jgi:prepilin-type N-terminal cleavage/methylation domain-containing protein
VVLGWNLDKDSYMQKPRSFRLGFTLIELSIVLVIIALVVGGVLVGRDLIEAAKIRSQINQIESLHTAMNIFRLKYGGLPGDLKANAALGFGLQSRSGANGQGDGDGKIEYNAGGCFSFTSGEVAYFWNDLFKTGLIKEGPFNYSGGNIDATSETIGDYLPRSKVGSGYLIPTCGIVYDSENNYFVLMDIRDISTSLNTYYDPMTPLQAYAIDSKMDDGLSYTGNVQAVSRTEPNIIGWGPDGDCRQMIGDIIHYNTANSTAANARECGLRFKIR